MKKIKTISIIIIFILSFPFHFAYDIFPNPISSIIFPVNESIWEHMKLIYFPYLFYTIIEYFILKKKKIKINNYLYSLSIIPIIGIIIYLIIFLPISYYIEDNLIINITILLTVTIIEEILSIKLLISKQLKYEKPISYITITLSILIITYLTYFPLKQRIFIDPQTLTYGIKKTH